MRVSTVGDVPAPTGGAFWTLLRFRLGAGTFAIETSALKEVVRAVFISALPKAPEIVEGVIDYRGEIVPVVDVRGRFRLPPAALAPSQHLLVAAAGPRTVALRVDEALDVVSVSGDAVDSRPQRLEGLEHLKGVARLGDGLVVIQDLDRFLSLDEAAQLDSALAASAGSRTSDPAGPDHPLR